MYQGDYNKASNGARIHSKNALRYRKQLRAKAEALKAASAQGNLDTTSSTGWGEPLNQPWVDLHPEKYRTVHNKLDDSWDEVAENPLKSEEQLFKEKLDADLAGWPWADVPEKLITLAPFNFNGYHSMEHNPYAPFKLPQAVQECPLFTKLLSNDVVAQIVVPMIFQHHSTAWKLAATCREASNLMSFYISHWDMVGTFKDGGWFNNCELPRYGPGAPEDPELQGSVASILIVSPHRRPVGPPSYYEHVRNLHRMSISMSNFADFFQTIHLHRIGFLNTRLLTLLIPKMRSLKALGIYQCPMLHVGETMKLLEIIKTDRPLERENQVYLDFYPMYHQGPGDLPSGVRNPFFRGEFGVTWDNFGEDSCRAIWAIVYRAYYQAMKQGFDITALGTAFRQWLDRGPCWNVAITLKAIENTSIDLAELAALVDSHNTEHRGNVGSFTDKNYGCRPEGHEPYVNWHHCVTCKTHLIGMFFSYKDIQDLDLFGASSTHNNGLNCLGCKITDYLRREKDHYKSEKRKIIRKWLYSGVHWNDNDLDKAILDFDARNIIDKADALDRQRMLDMNHTRPSHCCDHEFDERQNPLTFHEMNRKHEIALRQSPLVSDKDKVLTPWNDQRMDRRRAHGR